MLILFGYHISRSDVFLLPKVAGENRPSVLLSFIYPHAKQFSTNNKPWRYTCSKTLRYQYAIKGEYHALSCYTVPILRTNLLSVRIRTTVSATLDFLLTPLTFRPLDQLIPPSLNIFLHDPTQQYNGKRHSDAPIDIKRRPSAAKLPFIDRVDAAMVQGTATAVSWPELLDVQLAVVACSLAAFVCV